jgi:aryl-alcohol dehydrogenase-like predicted oxidoreductase
VCNLCLLILLQPFQILLDQLDKIASREGCDISHVAARWVLDHQCVACVVLGMRGSNTHADDNAKHILRIKLTDADREAIQSVVRTHGTPLKGDCGDEYRQ